MKAEPTKDEETAEEIALVEVNMQLQYIRNCAENLRTYRRDLKAHLGNVVLDNPQHVKGLLQDINFIANCLDKNANKAEQAARNLFAKAQKGLVTREELTNAQMDLDRNWIALNKKEVKEAEQKTASAIIKEAEDFECCPLCGEHHDTPHFCKIKEERFVENDDAYWFAQYLKKKYLEAK